MTSRCKGLLNLLAVDGGEGNMGDKPGLTTVNGTTDDSSSAGQANPLSKVAAVDGGGPPVTVVAVTWIVVIQCYGHGCIYVQH